MAEKKSKYSWPYAIFTPWVWAGAKGYYRSIKVLGQENLPPEGTPTILVSNHQNGMMDPVMLCLVHHKQLHFLTRADVFKKPLAGKFFRAINMMPVYRERDNVEDIAERNEEIFNECSDRLAGGNTVALFPEGTHGNVKHLRPAKKGAARLAFGAIQRHDCLSELVILPAGMDYTDFIDYRSQLSVRYGKVILVRDYLTLYQENPSKAINDLTRDLNTALQDAVVHYVPSELYPAGRVAFKLASVSGLAADEVAFSRKFSQAICLLSPENRFQLERDLLSYKQSCKSIGLKEEAFELKSMYKEFAVFAVLSPFWLVRIAARWVPFLWVERFVKRKVKDPHFISSARLILTMFALPVWWIFFGVLAAAIFQNAWLLLALPVGLGLSTLPGLAANDNLQLLMQRQVYRSHKKSNPQSDVFKKRELLLSALRKMLR